MGGVSGVADLDGIEARLAALPGRVNGDAVLLRRGRRFAGSGRVGYERPHTDNQSA